MNPNRQNNRCVTPGGPGVGGRMGGRQIVGPGCNPGAVSAAGCVVANDGCNPCGVVAANDGCSPCGVIGVANDAVAGGIIIGQSGSACNRETVLNGLPVAMAYVPWQCYGNLYSLPQALRNGTLFRELDLEFAGRRCN